MKQAGRGILIALVFLLIGAAVNVGVAWARSQPDLSKVSWWFGREIVPCAAWPRPVPEDWPSPEVAYEAKWWGRREFLVFGVVQEHGAMVFRRVQQLQVHAGWPALALEMELRCERDRHLLHTFVPPPQPHPAFWRGGAPIGERRYPVRPLWPGFAINTLLYAAFAAGLWYGSGTLWLACRAARRGRRNVCCRCGYSRAGLAADAVCPECGPSNRKCS